jgi:competence protein ComEC
VRRSRSGLLKTPLRWSGALLLVFATVWAARVPVPDVLVAGDGRTFAVRGTGGRLAFHHTGSDSFATREWLAGDADGRDVHDRSLENGITCGASGCIGQLADGALVAYATAPMRSRRIAAARFWSSRPAMRRRPVAPRR